MYARIYFHIPEIDVENPLSILIDTFSFIQQSRSTFRFAEVELYIRRNDEADTRKAAEFPDGFLYFSHTMEVYPEGDSIDVTNRILAAFWKAGIPAVCACDDEELLIEKGGYRSRNVPWVNRKEKF